MSFILELVEGTLVRAFASVCAHDAKLFIKAPAFQSHPDPAISVTSPECGDSGSELHIHHTPLGENRFPQLKWGAPARTTASETNSVAEYLLVVEDPDAPLPWPIVHGLYYGIPLNKTSLAPEDFAAVDGSGHALHGGFRFGANRMGTVWGGPKPVLDHGAHRYMFQVVGLSSSIEKVAGLSEMPTKAEVENAVQGKVVGWVMWIGSYEKTSG